MKPAVHTFNWIPWASRRGETLEIERVLAEVAEAGYAAVEFSRVPMELDDPARTARLLRKFRLELVGMSFNYKASPGVYEDLQRNARICADLGGTKAIWFDGTDWKAVGPGGIAPGFHNAVEAADAFAEFAASLGLDAVFHNHLRTNLETPAQIDDLLPRLRRCGFCIDTGHLIAARGDPVACIQKYARQIRHVHLKDTAFKPDGAIEEFVELGTGNHHHRVEDWLAALRQIGYDGWLTVEQDQTKTTPFASAKANREWLRRQGL